MSILAIITLGLGAIISIFLVAFITKKYFLNKENYKPELSISVVSDENEYCGIKLLNKGAGTAIIKKVDFWDDALNNNQTVKKSIDELFPFDKKVWMNNQTYDEQRDYYLGGGDSLYFGKLKKENIINKGKNYVKLKEGFDQKIKDIRIRIEYNDVYEKPQKTLLYNPN